LLSLPHTTPLAERVGGKEPDRPAGEAGVHLLQAERSEATGGPRDRTRWEPNSTRLRFGAAGLVRRAAHPATPRGSIMTPAKLATKSRRVATGLDQISFPKINNPRCRGGFRATRFQTVSRPFASRTEAGWPRRSKAAARFTRAGRSQRDRDAKSDKPN